MNTVIPYLLGAALLSWFVGDSAPLVFTCVVYIIKLILQRIPRGDDGLDADDEIPYADEGDHPRPPRLTARGLLIGTISIGAIAICRIVDTPLLNIATPVAVIGAMWFLRPRFQDVTKP